MTSATAQYLPHGSVLMLALHLCPVCRWLVLFQSDSAPSAARHSGLLIRTKLQLRMQCLVGHCTARPGGTHYRLAAATLCCSKIAEAATLHLHAGADYHSSSANSRQAKTVTFQHAAGVQDKIDCNNTGIAQTV